MQAASLFAFNQRQGCAVALVAHVTSGPDHDGEAFAKGPDDADVSMLGAICRGAANWLHRGDGLRLARKAVQQIC